MGDRYAHHDSLHPAAQSEGNQENQQNMGNAQKQVDDPGYRPIRLFSAHRRDGPQRQRRRRTDERGQQPYPEASGHAEQGPCKHVPAHPVRPEGVGKGRGKAALGKVGGQLGLIAEHAIEKQKQQAYRCGCRTHKGLCMGNSFHIPPRFCLRIRGSIKKVSRSAIELPTNTNKVEKSTMPKSSGKSPFKPASVAARPNPG